jgi:hypothetical protein
LFSEQYDAFVNFQPNIPSIVRRSSEKSLPRLPQSQFEPESDPELSTEKLESEIGVASLYQCSSQSQHQSDSPVHPQSPNAESEAASLIANNADSNDSDWTTESEGDNDSFDSFLFNDDDAKSFQNSAGSRFYVSGWSGECLQETEDIDFDLVYALHNFVATVEGQANAAKGDTMVLLDDSNSYWWLVRVVKDATIGMRNMDATRRHVLTLR